MGCLRLTYQEESGENFFQGLWKKDVASKNCDNYYAFGLTFNSYSRENSVPNKFKFNGMEEAQDLGMNWLIPSKFRTYDPALGRFNGIDPLSDKSNNISPYAFAMNNPLLFNDLMGADTTRTTVLQEVVVTAKRITQNTYDWFTGADVGYTGSGWGHGPRRAIAGMIGLGNNANNLVQLGLHSQLQSGKVNLTGGLLSKVKTDPALVKWQNQLIKILRSDPRFGKMGFVYKDGRVVGFGGNRAGGDNWNKLSLDNPILQSSTWQVASNELTWAVRNVGVNVEAAVKSDGTIVLNYGFTDTFDLSSQTGRSGAYNFISNITGFMYHDVVGGNSSLQVNANWETTVDEE